MANVIYPKFKEQALQGGVNLASGNIKAVLVDLADYTYSAAHEFLSDVAAAGRVATSANLASKTFTNGTFDSADPSFTAATGDQCEALILYIDTGAPSTSRLIAFIDGRERLQVAAAASTGGTSITVEDLPGAVASGVTLTLVSGTGPATIVTSGSAVLGDRSVPVSALSGNLSAGAIYEYAVAGTGLPVTPNGGDINVTVSASGWFTI